MDMEVERGLVQDGMQDDYDESFTDDDDELGLMSGTGQVDEEEAEEDEGGRDGTALPAPAESASARSRAKKKVRGGSCPWGTRKTSKGPSASSTKSAASRSRWLPEEVRVMFVGGASPPGSA